MNTFRLYLVMKSVFFCGGMTMNIAIGTKNRAKTAAVQKVVECYIDNVQFEALNVASNVADQPMSDEETRQGAINRAQATLATSDAQLGFGLEGGVKMLNGVMYLCNWAALATREGAIYTAAGAQIPLPVELATEIQRGHELGPIMDAYVQQANTREHAGAIGVFTNGYVDRQEMFEHILTLLVGQYMYFEKH